MLEVAPRNAIQTMVRMEWSMNEFFDNCGTTQFIDRVSASLGIHASTVKIVSVYDGSLVVNYGIENDNEQELEAAREAQTEAFATGAIDLGAPVLDVEATVTSDATTKPEASISTTSSEEDLAEALNTVIETTSEVLAEEESEVESIVSGGVVTAEDYDPIVITIVESSSSEASESETEESSSSTEFVPGTSYTRDSNGNVISVNIEEEVYVPDVQVIEEREIIENEIRTQITVEQEIIIQEEEVDTNAKSTIIIAATVAVVVLLATAYGMRLLYNRMNAEELEKVAIKAKQEEIHMTKMKSAKRAMQKNDIDEVDAVIDEVRQHGDSNMKLNPNVVSRVEDDEFEEQYNPLHDFAVFGVGNNRIGGNQTLQEKMNLADQSSSTEKEDEEDSGDNGNYDIPQNLRKSKNDYILAGDKSQSQGSLSIDPERKTDSNLSGDLNDQP